ncbi:hypothetical protein C0431_05715 [bacterium]|nr:hypothetical protein [bacterium]
MKHLAAVLILTVAATLATAQKFEAFQSKKADRWEASATYPQFLTRTAINGVANPDLKATVKKVFDEFMREAKTFEREGWQGSSWGLDLQPIVGVANAGIVSVMWNGYQFTGGANPQLFYLSRTYGPKDGKFGVLSLQDLLKKGTKPADFANKYVLPKLNNVKASRDIPPYEAMNDVLANQFVVTPAGITWLFSKYDVGAGVEGTYEIKLKWSDMPEGLDDKGILSGLMKKVW